ncbi:flagellar hook protein FlgE [Sphingomonas sp. RHCKR47]|uniref:flagellar hook protein FlgE n=1 Tax=Sphingomonas citricola TaxID=2862498 RepID=UPI001C665ABD|nr:flagellar hook protein FlgE [Sphingomonas citricola]MBW6524064.1 flagellar hook protein FlgE [Sphingomonas citricola]
MSFYTSLSGLQAAQTDLSTISHNLANVSTNGFKKSRSEFADVMASNFTSDPRRMVGSGAVLQQNRQQFSEGSLQTTGNSLDLTVAGDGFFSVKMPNAVGTQAYTRNGAFLVDPNRFIADSQGSRLQAYAVETDGTVPANSKVGDVRIPLNSGESVATGTVTLQMKLNAAATQIAGNFNAADASTYNTATSTSIIDAAGNTTTLTNYFVKDAPNDPSGATSWTMYSYAAGAPLNNGNGTKVTFDGDGNMTAPTGAIALSTTPAGAAGTAQQTISFDLTGSTAAKQPFAVVSRSQDGKAKGEFSSVSVDEAGIITASYSNGDSVKLGKVALANFVNPTGLKQNGGNYWTSTGLSGTATMGTSNENGFGKLMSGTIEGSNVDITEELVNLIAAQRNFQANSKALDTASQISQTIFNIRA